MTVTQSRFAWYCVPLALLLGGCQPFFLDVHTNPPNSNVVVSDAKLEPVEDGSGRAPLNKAQLKYDKENSHHTVTVTPPEDKADQYLESEVVLSQTDYEALEQVGPSSKRRRLRVTLEEVTFLDVYVDPPNSNVVIAGSRRDSGMEGTTPLQRVPVNYKEQRSYRVIVTPPENKDDQYLESEVVLNQTDYEALEQVGNNSKHRRLRVTLEEVTLLDVYTEPPNSNVVVASSRMDSGVEGTTPLQRVPVNYKEHQSFRVIVTPQEDKADQYIESEVVLNQIDYEALEQVGTNPNHRKLWVTLEETAFRPDIQIQVLVRPLGWVGFVNRVRSFLDTTELSGAVPTRVVELPDGESGISGLSLSPDGNRLAFSTSSLEDSQDDPFDLEARTNSEIGLQNGNLRAVRVSGGGLQHITTEDFFDFDPSFSSDGQYLIFSSNRRRPQSSDILRISADGRSGIADIYTNRRGERAVAPSMSADGTIAFALYPANWTSQKDIQIWTVGGKNEFPTQVARGMHPRISPDGGSIVYIGVDGNVWSIGADGREATQLTFDATSILERYKEQLSGIELADFEIRSQTGHLLQYYEPYSNPSWSPDGARIVYASMEANDPTGRPNHDIWIMNRDGSDVQQLTTNGSVDRFPVISPDQENIYFISNRGLRWAIWRIPTPFADSS